MQKKIKKSLAAILSLLMIMTAIPFTPVAVATDGADPISEKDCTEHADTDGNEFCDVCGELINTKVITADSDGMVYVDGEALEITGYYNNDLILPAGNYKLTGDVTSAYFITVNEGEVTLDLNGYVWDMRDCYLLLSNQFSLYDTSDAGTGKLTSSWGNTVYIGKTDTQYGTFNLYSGTVENTSTLTDAYIINASYGDANLYGGKIKGNAYAFFNYMFSDLTINLDGTVIENGEGYAQVKSDLMDGDTPKTVIDVTDYTGESFTVDAEIDEEGKIKIFEGIKSAQEAENYQINFLTKYGEVYCEKTEYDEATGEKYIYVARNAFTQQPSDKNNYTVEFNNPDASFQWYKVNENEIGKYTTEERDLLFPYDFKKGDILKVTTASEIEYAVIEAGSHRLRLDKENKTATVRIDEDETIEIFTRFVDPENDVELNFSVIKEISLKGETGKTLQTPEHGKSYWCKATVGEKVYASDIVVVCLVHDYDENGKCYYCKMQAAAKVTDKDGNAVGTYKTLAEAVTAASASEGSILTLLDDITLTETLNIGGVFTIDLNGKTLNCTSGNTIYIYPNGNYVLTVEDFSESKNGVIKSETGKAVNVSSGGKLILNSGTVTAENDYAISAVSSGFNNSLLEVHGGTVNGNVFCYGDSVITGGTFNGTFGVSSRYISNKFSGGIFNGGIKINSNKSLNKVLADGCHFRNAEGKITDGSSNSIEEKVTIEKGADLSEAVITLDNIEFTYNGGEIRPTVLVTVGGKTLTEGKDYTLTFANNVNAGIATVTVRGISQAAGGIAGGGEDIGNSSNSGDITESIYTGKIIKNFTIKPATVDIIWEGDEFYYTGNPHKVTAKYIDVNGDENPAAITQNKTNTEVGKYIATAIVEDANYTANGATINHAYEIKWYDGAPDAAFSGTKGENGWYTSEVTVTAPEGYAISTLADGIYGSEITFGNEENAVYYLKQAETGYIAKIELGKFDVDLNDPAAEITMAENKWNSFFNTVTFGKFFKETQSVTITASDETSGVAKIEYVVATEEITDFENAEWIEYTEAFTIQPNSKNIIYAKATDNAGRYVIVNSDGIVIYTDTTLDTSFKDEVVYVLTKNASQAFNLNLNGNTVAYVKIDETVLTAEDYEVLGNMILVSADVLENLAAGEYVITVGFNPMGEEFVDGDSPAEVTIPLTVKKADVTIEISDFGKVYDGKPVTADYKISKSSDSSPAASNIDYNETVEFKVKDSDDSTYTTEAPVNAGDYTVRITVAETEKINSAEATADFTIAKKPVTATATAPDKVYDGTTDILEYSKVVLKIDGAVEGEMLGYTVGKAWYDTADAGTDKTVHIIYAPIASNSIDNYEFPMNPEYSTDNCYVAAKADISRKDISDGFIILGDALTYNGTEQTQTVEKVIPTGTAPEVTYTVSGNKATNVGVYLLTVTGTGNFTGEAKIAYEIAVDTKCVYHIELVYTQINGVYEKVWKVKSTDRESLEYVLDQLNNAVTDIAPENKKERWNEMKADCEEILGIINSIEFFIADVEEDYAGFSEDTVKSSDISALDELAGKINAFKERYVYNLTDEEEKKLEDILDGIEKLKEKIAETEEKLEEIKDIENNFNPENVSSDDKAEIEDKIAEIEAVNPDNLTDEQKAEYDEIKAGFEALLEEITAAEKTVADIGIELEMFDEKRVTIFWEDDIEALKAKIDELLADENMGEAEKAKLNEYKAQAEKLTEIINTPVKYFSLRFFYFIWDSLHWLSSHVIFIFNWIVAMF